jgi:Sigma-70, region 4
MAGPIFANSVGHPLDLNACYQREMKDVLKRAGIAWHGWHGFRRGLASNLNRIGVDDSVRVVFVLRDIEGLSLEQTAEALDLSVAAVKARSFRTRLQLRGRLSRTSIRQKKLRASSLAPVTQKQPIWRGANDEIYLVWRKLCRVVGKSFDK